MNTNGGRCERCGAKKAGLQIINSNLAVMLQGKPAIENVCGKCWAAAVRQYEGVAAKEGA